MKQLAILTLFTWLTLITSCGIYSFSGASISSDIETANVHYFESQASLAPTTLSPQLTESIKDKLIAETNLSLTNIGMLLRSPLILAFLFLYNRTKHV